MNTCKEGSIKRQNTIDYTGPGLFEYLKKYSSVNIEGFSLHMGDDVWVTLPGDLDFFAIAATEENCAHLLINIAKYWEERR